VLTATSAADAERAAAGAVAAGQVVVKLATIGRVTAVTSALLAHQGLVSYPHVVSGLWYPAAATKNCASSVKWARDVLCAEECAAAARVGGSDSMTLMAAVRTGAALYGLDPSPATPCPPGFLPALTFQCLVGQVKTIPAGAAVSYGATWRAERPTRVAILQAGYADGNPPGYTARVLNAVGIGKIRGFFTNDTHEDWTIDEIRWGERVSRLTHGAHFIVNTATNGQGPLVPANRVRSGNEVLCNPPGRGAGPLPQVSPGYPNLDAFLWTGPPGNSSGSCNGGPPAGTFWAAKAVAMSALANGKLGPGFFLIQDGPVFGTDAPQRVERPGMHHLAQDAGVKQAQVVDGRDAVGQPLDQVQQRLKFGLGEEVVNADFGVRAADAVDAPVALNQANRIPGQIVVDDEAAVLEVLAFRENVRADENVDLLARRIALTAGNRSELGDDRAPLVRMVAAVDTANVRIAGLFEPLRIFGQAPMQIASRCIL